MSMNCPVCAVSLTMSTRQNVEIDYCPQCRGVWLDRGELDKIIERSAAEIAPNPTAQGQSGDQRPFHEQPLPHEHQLNYKHKRRKSFLEELFD